MPQLFISDNSAIQYREWKTASAQELKKSKENFLFLKRFHNPKRKKEILAKLLLPIPRVRTFRTDPRYSPIRLESNKATRYLIKRTELPDLKPEGYSDGKRNKSNSKKLKHKT